MKVTLYYEDNGDTELHKTLRITLPKSWKTGPTSKLLGQFVESYNSSDLGEKNPLKVDDLHLGIRKSVTESIVKDGKVSNMVSLASDAVIVDVIADRQDVYVLHGPSETVAEMEAKVLEEKRKQEEERKNTVQCTRFGCRNRFPRGGPYPPCQYHKSPPVFHETAKFWSCCPNKKAYDFEEFQNIPGCQTALACTEVKEEDQKTFLGGMDLRDQVGEAVKLKSIDDFNKAQEAGGSDAAPTLVRLQNVLEELGVEKELYQQVVEGIKKELSSSTSNDADLLAAVKAKLGSILKANLKSVAADQQRIK